MRPTATRRIAALAMSVGLGMGCATDQVSRDSAPDFGSRDAASDDGTRDGAPEVDARPDCDAVQRLHGCYVPRDFGCSCEGALPSESGCRGGAYFECVLVDGCRIWGGYIDGMCAPGFDAGPAPARPSAADAGGDAGG